MTIDPVRTPDAYRESLLAALADRDPARSPRSAGGTWRPESIDLIVRLAAGHDLVHLDQARRTLEVIRRVAQVAAGVQRP